MQPSPEGARGLLGCRHPLVLAGMGGVARSELVAAVTEAGGFGFLGMVREPVALLEQEVAQLRAAGHTRFGVNLIPAATEAGLLRAQVEACLALGVPAICLFWDLDARLVGQLRDAGVLVVYQVGSAAEAAAAAGAGAQIIIAQGVEAGGHVRGRQKLHELLPEVVAATAVPVLAAGGISSGADVARAMALGADGAVLGTAMLATHEAFAHPYHKQRLLAAAAEDTVLTERFHVNWPPGAAVRVIKSEITEGLGDHSGGHRGATIIGEDDGRPIVLHSTDSPLRTTTGKLADMALYAGMGVGRITEIASAGGRLTALAEAAEALVAVRGQAGELPENASPVCYAGTIGADYMGLLGREELLARLNGLLETVRGRLRLELQGGAGGEDTRLVRWAVRLARLLAAVGGEASRRNVPVSTEAGDRPQSVEVALRSLLPLVADECVRTPLEAMLAEFAA